MKLLDKMIRDAEKVIPGPWKYMPAEDAGGYAGFGLKDGVELGVTTHSGDADITAQYLANCSPEMIIALCNVAKAADRYFRLGSVSSHMDLKEGLEALRELDKLGGGE